MYSDIFCRVYNEFGWNYYPEAFAGQLLQWLREQNLKPRNCLDLGCGTGILCGLLSENGIRASGMDLSPGMVTIAREQYPQLSFAVADMTCYRPEERFDLVTCTGDALNHISGMEAVAQVFDRVYDCLNPGGTFVFDILNENEVSDSEPFEMDFSERVRVWFQMTRPTQRDVNLCIRVYEDGALALEENIGETIHDPAAICDYLRQAGFQVLKCADRLPEAAVSGGTTWFVVARKPD